jgi:hypothetical protein
MADVFVADFLLVIRLSTPNTQCMRRLFQDGRNSELNFLCFLARWLDI